MTAVLESMVLARWLNSQISSFHISGTKSADDERTDTNWDKYLSCRSRRHHAIR